MGKRNRTGFERLWCEASGRARSYIYCVCGDAAASDDILQESYLRAWRNWGRFTGQGSREGWLFGIIRRTCGDWFRKHKRLTARSLETVDESEFVVEKNGETIDIEPIISAIGQLQVDQREIVYMRFTGGLSYAQIAEALAIPTGTVRSRLHRAMKELRRKLVD